MRTAQVDTEIAGTEIAKGDWLYLSYLAGNLDPAVFDDPLRFDVTRHNADRHIAFGYGIHFCLGAALARLEGRIALDEVLNRFPEWDVDRDNARRDSLDEDAYRRDSVRNAFRAEARRDSVRRDSIQRQLMRSDSAKIDSLRNQALLQDSIRRETAKRDSIRRDSVRRDTIPRRPPDTTRPPPDSIRPDSIGRPPRPPAAHDSRGATA